MNIKHLKIGSNAGGQEYELLQALAGVYLTLHVIDLNKLIVYEYTTTDQVHRLLHGNEPVEERIHRVMDGIAAQEHKKMVFEFMDMGTLKERLREKNSIRMEFVSIYNGWVEAAFIVMKRDDKGDAVWVVFATRVINERKVREEIMRRASNTDKVTGFLNRRAYEERIADLSGLEPPDDFVFVAFDVNGLKEVNDSLGHEAGDELLRGAAACIKECFGEYGSLYRTGGDEFAGMLNLDADKILELGFAFEKSMATWHGTQVKELSISWGSAARSKYSHYTVQKLASVADRVMYKAKEFFYTQNGMDRRAQRGIYDVICSTYVKALQVYLGSDTYHILQMDGLEHDAAHGFSASFSQWQHDFAVKGGVHEADLAEFLAKVNRDALREYFQAGNKSLTLFYRRNIRGIFRRVMLEAIPAPDYSEQNEQVFLFVKNVEK